MLLSTQAVPAFCRQQQRPCAVAILCHCCCCSWPCLLLSSHDGHPGHHQCCCLCHQSCCQAHGHPGARLPSCGPCQVPPRHHPCQRCCAVVTDRTECGGALQPPGSWGKPADLLPHILLLVVLLWFWPATWLSRVGVTPPSPRLLSPGRPTKTLLAAGVPSCFGHWIWHLQRAPWRQQQHPLRSHAMFKGSCSSCSPKCL